MNRIAGCQGKLFAGLPRFERALNRRRDGGEARFEPLSFRERLSADVVHRQSGQTFVVLEAIDKGLQIVQRTALEHLRDGLFLALGDNLRLPPDVILEGPRLDHSLIGGEAHGSQSCHAKQSCKAVT